MKTYYLGLSVTYHDPALAIINEQGEVLYAEATERCLQNKRALNCAPDQLLHIAGILETYCPDPGEFVVSINWLKKRPLYETVVARLGYLSAPGLLKPGFKRLRSPLENYQLHHMIACQRNSIVTAGINLVRKVRELYPRCKIRFADFAHHLTHAATACYSSPFEHAACAVVDSFGENGSMAFYRYRNRRLQLLHETKGTGSLGFYYMKITELCGFDWLKGEEWKVMGLAPYGRLNQALYRLLQSTITVDGLHCSHPGKSLFDNIEALRQFQNNQDSPIQSAANLAYTGQFFFAELMTRLLQHLYKVSGSDYLTLAGGCALNSSFSGQITGRTSFKRVFIPSAPADDGTALGAAWLGFYRDFPDFPGPAKLLSPYTGSTISESAITRLITFNGSLKIRHLPGEICTETAGRLARGQLIGWIQGRAEYGPRALGNRSILADPRHAVTKDQINQKIKFRETFRPFAPAILHQYGDEYFENYQESPYMDKTLSIRSEKRKTIAAVCHVDGTGRLQTVKKEWNPRFYHLIDSFYRITAVPVLLNTSFNIMGKPLVHSLEDAVSVFLTTGLDALVIEDYLICKPGNE